VHREHRDVVVCGRVSNVATTSASHGEGGRSRTRASRVEPTRGRDPLEQLLVVVEEPLLLGRIRELEALTVRAACPDVHGLPLARCRRLR
jgi:hypothetical protein